LSALYLLDTRILSDLVRHPQGVVAVRIAQKGEESVCTSIVVAAELRFGAAKRGSERLTAQLEAVLSAVEILPLEEPADRRYGELRNHLEQQGTTIGPNDMLIAAHAFSLGLTVVTANAREFSRVPGLTVEDWLEKGPATSSTGIG
jgi:tRNA(fMet)-specific endonuclease VapC